VEGRRGGGIWKGGTGQDGRGASTGCVRVYDWRLLPRLRLPVVVAVAVILVLAVAGVPSRGLGGRRGSPQEEWERGWSSKTLSMAAFKQRGGARISAARSSQASDSLPTRHPLFPEVFVWVGGLWVGGTPRGCRASRVGLRAHCMSQAHVVALSHDIDGFHGLTCPGAGFEGARVERGGGGCIPRGKGKACRQLN